MEWDLRHYKNGALLHIRVQTHAPENCISTAFEGILRIKVTAPPVKGAANEACIKLLSCFFKIPKSQIACVRGLHSKDKWLWFQSLDPTVMKKTLDLEILNR